MPPKPWVVREANLVFLERRCCLLLFLPKISFLKKINVCSFFFIFPENSMFCTVYSWIVLQNLFIVEVTREVLEVTLEEGIHSHSCQTLVSSENGSSKPFKRYF